MDNSTLFVKLNSLPENLKSEVLDFIEVLLTKTKKNKEDEMKKRKAGCMKGTFKMSDDFDEPLEDFKDYM